MTFNQDPTDAPRNDRLLVLSMLGIVVMTAIAFGINMMNRRPLPAVPPAAPPIQTTPPTPRPAVQPTEDPAPVQPQQQQEAPPTYTPPATNDPGWTDQQPVSQGPMAPRPAGGFRNPKIGAMREITGTH